MVIFAVSLSIAGNMTPISAVILTLNEEKNIGRCLDSLQGVADEIVVVDSFSTDRTEEICREKGVRFIAHTFEGYIEQKNWALTQASYDHIISLDADEALSEPLKASVLEAKEQWTNDGYTMNRLTNYCGTWIRHSSWYPDRKLRLFDRRMGKWGGLNPHDVFLLHEDCHTRHLKGDLLHYSYYTYSDHLKQVDHFTSIAARAMFEKGRKANFVKLFLNPPFVFFRNYFLKLGILDGFHGYLICHITAMATFIKYAKLRALNRSSNTTR